MEGGLRHTTKLERDERLHEAAVWITVLYYVLIVVLRDLMESEVCFLFSKSAIDNPWIPIPMGADNNS